MSCKKFQTDVKKAFDVLDGKKNISAENRSYIIDNLKSIDGIRCDKKLIKKVVPIFDRHFGNKQNYTESRVLELYDDLSKQLETKLDCADESDSDSDSNSESDCDLENERLTEIRAQLRSITPLRNTERDMWLCPDCNCEVCECIKTTLAERIAQRTPRSQSPMSERMSQRTPRPQSPCPERISRRSPSPRQSSRLCPICQALEAECKCLENTLTERMMARRSQSQQLERLSQKVPSPFRERMTPGSKSPRAQSRSPLRSMPPCPICQAIECICEENALFNRLSRRSLSPGNRRSVQICPRCKSVECECPIHSQRAKSPCASIRQQMEIADIRKKLETASQNKVSEKQVSVNPVITAEVAALEQQILSGVEGRLGDAMEAARIVVVPEEIKSLAIKALDQALIDTSVIDKHFRTLTLASNLEIKEHMLAINKIIAAEWTKLSREQKINYYNLQ